MQQSAGATPHTSPLCAIPRHVHMPDGAIPRRGSEVHGVCADSGGDPVDSRHLRRDQCTDHDRGGGEDDGHLGWRWQVLPAARERALRDAGHRHHWQRRAGGGRSGADRHCRSCRSRTRRSRPADAGSRWGPAASRQARCRWWRSKGGADPAAATEGTSRRGQGERRTQGRRGFRQSRSRQSRCSSRSGRSDCCGSGAGQAVLRRRCGRHRILTVRLGSRRPTLPPSPVFSGREGGQAGPAERPLQKGEGRRRVWGGDGRRGAEGGVGQG